MEELIDLIATDSAASEVSSKVKEILFTKAAERVENARPLVASSLFGEFGSETEVSEEEQA